MSWRAVEWARRHEAALWTAGLLALTAAGLAFRLARALGGPRLPDEEICVGLAARVGRPGTPWPLHGGDHPLLGIYLLAASRTLFGDSLLGYRTLGVLAGGLTPLVTALAVARSSSRPVGLLAAALLALNPLHAGLSALAIEIPFQLLFAALAWWGLAALPAGGRRSLMAAAACLGLAFLCSESTALYGLGFLIVLARRPERRLGLSRRDFLLAAAVAAAIVAPDVVYNLTATRTDFRYVNYLDHLSRIAAPTLSLQGVGFFLRDLFTATLSGWPRLWTDYRCEYPSLGIGPGLLLLLGALHAWRPGGDPSGGFWRLPPLLFVLVTSLAGPGHFIELDRPMWTWPLPTLPLVTASTALMVAQRWPRGRALFVALLLATLLPGPDASLACD